MRSTFGILLPLLAQLVSAGTRCKSSTTSASAATTLTTVTISTSATSPPATTPVPYSLKTPPLDTPWTDKVGTNPWPEHPRPQLKRDAWKNLNGIWTYQPASGDGDVNSPPSGPLAQEILIPSCIESALSGIQELNVTHMWFATTFTVPEDWSGQSIILNFEAIDYEATVFINGIQAGFHRGGYFRFTVDATQFVDVSGSNSL